MPAPPALPGAPAPRASNGRRRVDARRRSVAHPGRGQVPVDGLGGFDSGWTTTDAGRRRATYTNLDAGSYRFRVRGANPDGVWNEEEATVR
ncbi:MAG: hypothetical protein GY715_22215, partial [Planctomycetes bacterium]|nr:hypothetical protein [Planctomycetota bacterium]